MEEENETILYECLTCGWWDVPEQFRGKKKRCPYCGSGDTKETRRTLALIEGEKNDE